MIKTIVCAALLSFALVSQAAAPSMKVAGSHASLSCETCHQGGKYQAPDKAVCLNCHKSYTEVAKRTEKMTPNPHFSHRGEPQCTDCHSMHAKSRFECNDCHTFDVKMKGE